MRENTRNYSRKVKSWTINKEKGMFKKEDIKVGMIVEIREYSKVFKEYLKRLYMLLPDYKGDLVFTSELSHYHYKFLTEDLRFVGEDARITKVYNCPIEGKCMNELDITNRSILYQEEPTPSHWFLSKYEYFILLWSGDEEKDTKARGVLDFSKIHEWKTVGRIVLPGGEGCVMKRDTWLPNMKACSTYTVQDVLDDYGKMLAECRTDSTTQELKREGE